MKYRIEILEKRWSDNSQVLESHPIADPFIRSRIYPSGFRAALAVLFGKLHFQVSVTAETSTIDAVLALNDV